jgi:RNA polymerase sigma-70 factor (sigma-E family)
MDDERRKAFDELVRTRSSALLRTAFLLTGDWAHAEDLLQTALAKAYVRWSSLRDVGAGETYVRRVLATTSGKWWRRRWHGEVPTVHQPGDGPRVADHADDTAVREMVARALAALPPAHRAVVVLRFFDDLSERQVAELLGVPPGTVKSRTARALATLRESGLLDDDTFPARLTARPLDCGATP